MRSDLIILAWLDIHHFWWSWICRCSSRTRVRPLWVSIGINLELILLIEDSSFQKNLSLEILDQHLDLDCRINSLICSLLLLLLILRSWRKISQSLGMWKVGCPTLGHGKEEREERRHGEGGERNFFTKTLFFRNPRDVLFI